MFDTAITIADILIELRSRLSPADLGIEAVLGPYFGRTESPAARVSLLWQEGDCASPPPGELIYDPGAMWRMYRSGNTTKAEIAFDRVSPAGSVDSRCLLAADAQWDRVTLIERTNAPGWTSLLRIGAGELIVRTKLLFCGGVVFHAAGIDDGGRGVVFVGHSGAGKSTLARLWTQVPGALAINDDRMAIRATTDGVWCYGTPWGGDAAISSNHTARVAAIMVLSHAPETAVERLAPSAAAALLSARAFLPYWDRALVQRALANLEAILVQVPVYHLGFRPDASAIQGARSVL